MTAVIQNPDVRNGLEGTGGNVAPPMNAAALEKVDAAEVDRYRAIAKGINLQPQ